MSLVPIIEEQELHNYFMFNTAIRLKIYRNILEFLFEKNISIGCCNELYIWRKEGAVRK